MNTPGSPPSFVSLHRLAKLCGRTRVTLLLQLKDGKLVADALLDVGQGRSLPLFSPDKAALLRLQKAARRPHPLL